MAKPEPEPEKKDPEGKEEAKPSPAEERDRLVASLQRVQADFQNFRSRMERERAQWRQDLTAEAVLPFLGALDNLNRALESAKAGGTLETMVQGVTQVTAQVEKALKEMGITRIAAEGKPFDPKLHEVLSEVPAAGAPAGQVVHVVEQGYTAGGRVVRPARVTVAAGGRPSEEAAPQTD